MTTPTYTVAPRSQGTLEDALAEAMLSRLAPAFDARFDAIQARLDLLLAAKAAPPANKKLIGKKELAEQLGVDPRSVRHMELAGELPARVACGSRPRWVRSAIDAWIAAGGGAVRQAPRRRSSA